MLSPVICCSKNSEHCFQSRDLFWSCTSQILTTGVKTAPGSVTDSCTEASVEWLELLGSEKELEGLQPPPRPHGEVRRPRSVLHNTCIWLGFICVNVNPRLILSVHPELLPFPWSPWADAHSAAFLPLRAPPCCFALLLFSHLSVISSHLILIKCNHKGTT